jgi:hypothetical protein
MSDVIIKYNNKRVPASGCGPTPYLSLTDEVITHGNRWGISQRIVLNGLITGNSFNDLYTAQTGLVDIFSSSYKILKVLEGSDDTIVTDEVAAFSGCSVQNISFDNAPYNKVVSYSVELLSYPSGLTGFFSGNYGILEPKDEINISPGNDGVGTVTHSVSAKGFVINTIDDAIDNVKTYVDSRTGVSRILSLPLATSIDSAGSFAPVLVSISENLDRLNLTYSIEETYKFKTTTGDSESAQKYSFNNYNLVSYSTSLTSGAGDDFVTASIQGEIKAGITGATGDALISSLINELSGLNPYAIISGKYGSPNNFKFCTDPIEVSINEDRKARKINFNISYDNLEFYNSDNDQIVFDGCYLDATISHNIDDLSFIDTLEIKGEVKSRGSVFNKYEKSLNYITQLFTAGVSASAPRLYTLVNSYYSAYYGGSPKFTLNSEPVSVQVDANPLLGTVSLSVSYDNKDRFLGLSVSDYSIEYTPTNTVFTYGFSCNNSLRHIAVDMNVLKREKTAINLSLSKPSTSENSLLTDKDTLMTSFKENFIKPLLELKNRSSLDTMQEESSNVSVSNSNFNSSNSDIQTTNKFGSVVSTNSVFSFALDPEQAENRAVIKS